MKEKLAFTVMRIGVGVVFVLFGLGKFKNDIWVETIKNMEFFLKLPWNVNMSVAMIGVLETLTGAALITGSFSRFFSFLASLELVGILILLNFQETRDIGLLATTIYMVFSKQGSFGVDYLLRQQSKTRE